MKLKFLFVKPQFLALKQKFPAEKTAWHQYLQS